MASKSSRAINPTSLEGASLFSLAERSEVARALAEVLFDVPSSGASASAPVRTSPLPSVSRHLADIEKLINRLYQAAHKG